MRITGFVKCRRSSRFVLFFLLIALLLALMQTVLLRHRPPFQRAKD